MEKRHSTPGLVYITAVEAAETQAAIAELLRVWGRPVWLVSYFPDDIRSEQWLIAADRCEPTDGGGLIFERDWTTTEQEGGAYHQRTIAQTVWLRPPGRWHEVRLLAHTLLEDDRCRPKFVTGAFARAGEFELNQPEHPQDPPDAEAIARGARGYDPAFAGGVTRSLSFSPLLDHAHGSGKAGLHAALMRPNGCVDLEIFVNRGNQGAGGRGADEAHTINLSATGAASLRRWLQEPQTAPTEQFVHVTEVESLPGSADNRRHVVLRMLSTVDLSDRTVRLSPEEAEKLRRWLEPVL